MNGLINNYQLEPFDNVYFIYLSSLLCLILDNILGKLYHNSQW